MLSGESDLGPVYDLQYETLTCAFANLLSSSTFSSDSGQRNFYICDP